MINLIFSGNSFKRYCENWGFLKLCWKWKKNSSDIHAAIIAACEFWQNWNIKFKAKILDKNVFVNKRFYLYSINLDAFSPLFCDKTGIEFNCAQ